jgi:hypothetical protein
MFGGRVAPCDSADNMPMNPNAKRKPWNNFIGAENTDDARMNPARVSIAKTFLNVTLARQVLQSAASSPIGYVIV